jgi:1-acyl-sn-glycerol-3-phosphate acyltransferase
MLSRSDVLTTTYRHPPERRSTRWVIRATLLALGPFVRSVEGADRLRRLDGPFVVALNHSQQLEAFLVPALLAWLRGGRIIRFLADWNFMLLPPVYVLYKSARVIPVTSKPARPRFLTRLRDLIAPPPTGFDCARDCLDRGRPVGVFVEGTTNPHPARLLRGRRGAARLSRAADVPVLPVGIRFPDHDDPAQPIGNGEPLSVHVGVPMRPPPTADLADWHAMIMRAVADCADAHWAPSHARRPRALAD